MCACASGYPWVSLGISGGVQGRGVVEGRSCYVVTWLSDSQRTSDWYILGLGVGCVGSCFPGRCASSQVGKRKGQATRCCRGRPASVWTGEASVDGDDVRSESGGEGSRNRDGALGVRGGMTVV